jgi:2-polyprenyl-3-methyl-5-hydroxy-6-metoxy-1,4-benzoquinol methylase
MSITVSTDMTQRVVEATTGALELFAVHLGSTLGLYDALDRHGPMTAHELAERADINERYAREWLEQQAVAGFLTVADDRFALPAAHRGALVDAVDGDHVAPFAAMLVGIAGVLDDVAAAYRTGGGVEYAKYGSHFRQGQGAINRPAFSADLVKSWLPAVDGVTERLAAGGRLVDIGTGVGWSAIAVKSSWPVSEVIGVDVDGPSIADARRNAEMSAVDVRFEVADPSLRDLGVGPVDVVLVLESLHDMARPVDVLAAARASLRPGGVVVVADEAVADTFTAPGDDLERMMYGWSVTHCLPASMAEQPSAALGTALRPGTVAELATTAGFAHCDVVDVDAGFFRIYRLSN